MNSIKKELEDKKVDSNSYDYLCRYLKDNNLLDKIDEYTNRLLNGEPVQYIIGNVEFINSKIKVDKRVLIPRFETELLVDKTIKYIKKYFNQEVKVLDIGTGSGAIAISINKMVNSVVDGVDISSEALEVAKENNIINNTNVNFFNSDIFSNVRDKYDVIISNPPYISKDEEIMDIVKNNEPLLALYANDNGLYFYDRILRECSKYLNKSFIIAFEIGSMQGNDIMNMAYKYLDDIEVKVEKDYSGRDRFVFIFGGACSGLLL